MKHPRPHSLIAVLLLLSGALHDARAQSDNFFFHTNTETFTHIHVANRNLGDSALFTDVTQERTNSVSSVNNDVWLNHISTTARAGFGSLFLAMGADYGTGFDIGGSFDFFEGDSPSLSSVAWRDYVTISHPSLNGSLGYLRVNLAVSGYMLAAVAGLNSVLLPSVNPNWSIKLGNKAMTAGDATYTAGSSFVVALPPPPPVGTFVRANSVVIDVDAAALAASNSVAHLDLPFIYGQTFELYCHVRLAAPISGGASSQSLSAVTQDAVKVQWQGSSVLDSNLTVVSDFTLASESGTAWVEPQPAVAGVLQVEQITLVSETNLVVNSIGGAPTNLVCLLTSTDLFAPMTNWVSISTNLVDLVGHVSFTNQINPVEPQRFFRLLSL